VRLLNFFSDYTIPPISCQVKIVEEPGHRYQGRGRKREHSQISVGNLPEPNSSCPLTNKPGWQFKLPDLTLSKPLAQKAIQNTLPTLGISNLKVLNEIVKPGW